MLNIDDSLVNGKKVIVDTNFYRSKSEDFLNYLYNFRDLSEVDSDRIITEINDGREGFSFIRKYNAQTISEVILEIQPFIDSLNKHLEFQRKLQRDMNFSNLARYNPKPKNNHFARKKNGRIKSSRELNIKKRPCEQYNLIQTLVKDRLDFIDRLKVVNLDRDLSTEQRNAYTTNLEFFKELAKVSSVHRDFSEYFHSFKGKKAGSIKYTDEKLVSLAFALALENDVCLFSNDSDINRMLRYSRNFRDLKDKMGFIEPKKNIELFCNVSGDQFSISLSYFP